MNGYLEFLQDKFLIAENVIIEGNWLIKLEFVVLSLLAVTLFNLIYDEINELYNEVKYDCNIILSTLLFVIGTIISAFACFCLFYLYVIICFGGI